MARVMRADWPEQWQIPFSAPVWTEEPMRPSHAMAVGMMFGVAVWALVGLVVWVLV